VHLGRIKFRNGFGLCLKHRLAVQHDRIRHQKLFTCSL
jgi:hypothetical protein